VTAKTPTSDLLALAYQGEQAAFDQLYRTHNRQLLLYLYRLTRDHHTAEDLMQEAFLRGFQKIREGDRPKTFIPWLYRVARNLALNSKVALTVRAGHERVMRQTMATHTVQENGKWHLSEDILQGLTSIQCDVLTRRYVMDGTIPEIAEQTGLHRNSVHKYLAQAQDVIRRRRVEGELP
jgi:RNA polymerase sigma-70 factor (ECF subfamily)